MLKEEINAGPKCEVCGKREITSFEVLQDDGSRKVMCSFCTLNSRFLGVRFIRVGNARSS